MNNPKLLIRYQKNFICEFSNNVYDFIKVPVYFKQEAFANITLFIMFLSTRILDENYYSTIPLNWEQDSWRAEIGFIPECLTQIDQETFFYDFDDVLNDFDLTAEVRYLIVTSLEHIPNKLRKIEPNMVIEEPKKIPLTEEELCFYNTSCIILNPDLINMIRIINTNRSSKDVLLLFSGGRDSFLSAARLLKEGYHVYLLHFTHDAMLDVDKPYLTWKKSFFERDDNVYFPYEYSQVNIQDDFKIFFDEWKQKYGDILEDASLHSEVRCLACRSAMYLNAVKIARKEGFHYIAEGARISQKFMIEQPALIKRFKDLASLYNIEILYPVLDLNDDQKEISELIKMGYSSKTWESKCLLGRKAMEKTAKDEKIIESYYDKIIYPVLTRKF